MESSSQPSRHEAWILAAILFVYALTSWMSLRWYPVFMDEPGYTDPAVSFLLGQGFTSGAWYAQGYESFWAGNVPLHQVLLMAWIKLWGFSQSAVRSINIVWVVAGMVWLWLGIRRLGILQSPSARLAAISLVLLSHPGGIWVNLGRPDAIGVALAGLLVWAVSFDSRAWRYGWIALIGVLAPWAAVQLALVLGIAGVALLVCFRKRYLGEVGALAAGGVVGAVSLLALYQSRGVLDEFLVSLLPHSTLFGKATGVVPPPVGGLKHRMGAFTDYTFLALIAAWVAVGVATIRRREARPWLLAGGVALVVIPCALALIGVFPIYYAWFASIPALVVLMGVWERGLIQSKPLKAAAVAALAGMVLLGYPRVWITGFMYRGDDVNGTADKFVSGVLRQDDVVFTQPQGWYAAKTTAARVYHGFRAPNLTQAEAESITVVICNPKFFFAQRDILPGKWANVERLSVPNRNTHRLPFSKWYRDNPMIDLYVYRRED